MMSRPVAAAGYFVVVFAVGFAPAAAQGAAPLTPEEGSLQAFGANKPTCVEWNDSCATCERDSAGAVHCSTPGIACQPREIVCRLPKP